MFTPILLPLAVLLILLPGFAVEASFSDRQRLGGARDSLSQLADSFAAALAVIAFAGMVTFFLPVHLFGPVLWALAALLVAWVFWQRFRVSPEDGAQDFSFREAAPLVLFAAVLLFRFYQARELVLPAWVDSIHHSLLVRMFLEQGAWPPQLEPYIQAPLVYHSGFHSTAAVFAYFSGLESAQAVLVFGQLLNAAVSLGMYRLVCALGGGRRRAMVAMLLVGFVFQMPAYYLTWGRVTLLAGLCLLLPAMAAFVEGLRSGFTNAILFRLGLLTTGLLLTHYYAAGVWALFLVVFVLARLVQDRGFFRSRELKRLSGAIAAGLLLASPWLAHVFVNAAPLINLGITLPEAGGDGSYAKYLWYLLGPYRSHVLHVLALTGLVLLGWQKRLRPFAAFTLAFIAISLPWAPRFGPFRPDHAVILAFIPAAVFAAEVLVAPLEIRLPERLQRLVWGLFFAGLAGLLVWGIRDTRSVINPVTVLVDETDVRALDWIEENIPSDAVFLINVTVWQGGAYRGVDGGWWISAYTGRRTFLPPALYLDGEPDVVQPLLSQAARMAEVTTCDAEFWDLVMETQASYVYTRFGKGSLQPAGLAGCAGAELKYEGGGGFIFEVRGPGG